MANSLPSTNNSLTQFLTQLLRIQKNSMEIIGKLSEVTSSSAQSVFIQLEDQSGAMQNYEVPSIGYIENEISRLDKNFNSLIGLDGGDVNVRMSDGSFKKIVQSTLFKQPKKIGQLLVPSTFGKKNNWFFESFLNPLLYVSFDVTNYVDYNTQQLAYKRIIANCDTDEKKLYFDQNIKGKNDLDYDTLLNNMYSKNITYFVDEDIANLPVSVPRYSGSFDVISFKDEVITIVQPNGTSLQTKARKYNLNTLKYTDNLQNFKGTMILKPGDKIDIGESTRYEVTTVDTSTNSVILKMTSGTEPIPIGVEVMRIAVNAFAIKEVQINVGFDEREVIFVKAIDKDTNLTTRDFSPGVGFYSNELVITTPSGDSTLEAFYKQEVMDFGSSILSLAKEGTIPSVYGEKPDAPRLTASNFKVTLVNAQKQDTDVINNLKKKISQKNTTASEITQLEVSIDKKKQELNISKFNSDAERRGVQNQLDSLIRDKTSKSNLYASIVKDLGTTAKNLPPELSNPLYRVRGFFPIPAAKTSKKTLDQEVISFIISYRYLRTDGTSPATEQIDFVDNNGETIRGYFSNWEEMHTKIREKVYDDTLGIYVWKKENVQDADSININQIDIAISKGEQVEIRVKSVSEAGWPTNPMISDWSSSAIISFPDNLTADEEVLASLASALSEETRVNFNQDLASRGLDIHLSTSFTQKDKYYAHPSDSISSGFFDTSGNAIDLYNKLKDMDNQIATLKALIEKAKGSLQVYIVDPSGEKYLVSNNSTVDLFAGYYSDIVAALPTNNQKGAIITSLYKLIISNSAVSALQLASSFPGGLEVGLPSSTVTGVDQDYARRRYDAVPVSLSSLDANRTTNANAYQVSPFQSAQQLSQYIYNRYTDIGLKTPLYGATVSSGLTTIANNSLYATVAAGTSSFVWKGTYTGSIPDGGGDDNVPFSIHILHPDINDGSSTSYASLNEPIGATSTSPAVYPKILHARFFNAEAFDPDGKLQVQYIPTNVFSATVKERYPIKLGFYTNDRYLIGTDTCGSYLFMAPSSYADLLVDGTDYRAIRNVEFGDENQITIPIVYQFRMTDFYGIGDSGTGRIGGYSVQPKNLVYTKKIGIDIAVKDDSLFSFDLQVSSKYKVDSPSQTAISPAKNSKLSSSQTSSINKIF
jgi:hypothetical protein